MRCKTLTAIYKNEINTLKKLYEIDFLIHKSVRIHIEQFTVRKIEIDFTSEQLVDDLIAVLTKVERLLILPDFYISLYPHWHKTRIYIQNVTRDRANICVMCFSISKPLGSTLLYCRNCLFCFIFLQSLVRVLLPICWKFGLRRIYMECSSILRAILRSRVYFPICCTDY